MAPLDDKVGPVTGTSARETHPSICRLCPAHCPILVTVEGGRPVEVVGDPDAPLFGGYTCPKGRALRGQTFGKQA